MQIIAVGLRKLGPSRSNVTEVRGVPSLKYTKNLGITITQMIDERIMNESIQTQFFDIPTIRNQIAQRQLTFIGKVVRNKDDQITTQLLTARCNNKRRRVGVLQNNKKNLAQSIRLVIPGEAKDGLLKTWVYFALDAAYWK